MISNNPSMECVVPATLDGWAALHSFYRINWPVFYALPQKEQDEVIQQAKEVFQDLSKPEQGHTGFFSILGHKADLLFLHFRPSLDDLNQIELSFAQTKLFKYLIPTTSYVSFVELGMYAMTQKIFDELLTKGLEPESDEWNKQWDLRMQDQMNRMKGRIFCEIPSDRYLCFYPMDKRRGERHNWYAETMQDRSEMMFEHGMVGRKYAGQVTQVISGSIGSDDWEWGVDLFAKDPLVFKKLIYEMRFDRASAFYAEFGAFYAGLQFQADQIESFLKGQLPSK